MEFDDIERILELMQQHELLEFEMEQDGLKLRVRKTGAGYMQQSVPAQPLGLPQAPLPAAIPSASVPLPPAAPASIDEPAMDLAVVKSPIVGTFYRSSEPGTSAFVDVGDRVKKDQVLCIIEAMKLMNEIDSEYDGEIVNIYVESGQPVQYGERLFAIRTR